LSPPRRESHASPDSRRVVTGRSVAGAAELSQATARRRRVVHAQRRTSSPGSARSSLRRAPARRWLVRLQCRRWEREDPPVDRREETVVFVRVVRFTDVTAERVESLVAQINESGPPPGVAIRKLQLVFDEAQGTAVVLQYFDDEEKLRTGAETFAAMDPSETPGNRVSVDTGELRVEREP
jgi:hypothetical protein